MKTLSISGKDPNIVVEHDGQIYRKIAKNAPERWAGLDEFLHSDPFMVLMNRGWFVRHDLEHPMEVDGEVYYPVENIRHFNHSSWWTDRQCIAALQLIAKINEFLFPYHWQAADCHMDNITFLHGNPVYVDTGSLSQNQQDMAFGHFYEAGRKRFGLELPLNWTEAQIALSSFKQPEYSGTEWDYYDKSGLPKRIEDIDPKTKEQLLITRWVGAAKPKDVMDLGANRGLFSRLVARLGIDVIAVDVSQLCADLNWETAKALGLPITSLFADIADKMRQEDSLSLWHRSSLPCDLVLASSITHHLFRQGMTWDEQGSMFRKLAKSRLLVEFISPNDPCIVHWKLPPGYSQNAFLNAFKAWRLKEEAQPENGTRTWYYFEKP